MAHASAEVCQRDRQRITQTGIMDIELTDEINVDFSSFN